MLEGLAARLAAVHATDDGEMRAAYDEHSTALERGEAAHHVPLDLAFHARCAPPPTTRSWCSTSSGCRDGSRSPSSAATRWSGRGRRSSSTVPSWRRCSPGCRRRRGGRAGPRLRVRYDIAALQAAPRMRDDPPLGGTWLSETSAGCTWSARCPAHRRRPLAHRGRSGRGAARNADVRRAGRRARGMWDERRPSLNLPSATVLAATWDPPDSPPSTAGDRRRGTWPSGCARGPRADRQHPALPARGPSLRVLQRGPGAHRGVDGHGTRPRLAVHRGVAAAPKHYVANDYETQRFTASSEVSVRRPCTRSSCVP